MGIILGFGHDLGSSKVLLVDDDAFMRRLFEAQVRTLGCEVVTAKNGEEAVKMIPDEKPDLVLMDVVMPGMDGFEACIWMRRLPQMKGVPVVLLTALGRDAKERSFAAGATGFLRKPPSLIELQTRLATLLLIRRLEQELGDDTPPDEPLSKDSSFKPVVWMASANQSLCLRITAQLDREGFAAKAFPGLAPLSDVLESELLPDLLILDHDPKDGDAVEVSKRIRAEEATAHVPILMLVLDSDLKAELNEAPCGASEFLGKNPDAADLRQRMKLLLRLSVLESAHRVNRLKA
ncbi:MAG: response regulator [Acidobacteriota bacterium]|nr:response regulator [Acidobacteriota bacterium]